MNLTSTLIPVTHHTESNTILYSCFHPHKHSNQHRSFPSILCSHLHLPSLHYCCCFSDLYPSSSIFSYAVYPTSKDFTLFLFCIFLLSPHSPLSLPSLSGPSPSPSSCLYFICCCTRLPPSTDLSLLFFNVGLWTLKPTYNHELYNIYKFTQYIYKWIYKYIEI